jgi:hypothetical protein
LSKRGARQGREEVVNVPHVALVGS